MDECLCCAYQYGWCCARTEGAAVAGTPESHDLRLAPMLEVLLSTGEEEAVLVAEWL